MKSYTFTRNIFQYSSANIFIFGVVVMYVFQCVSQCHLAREYWTEFSATSLMKILFWGALLDVFRQTMRQEVLRNMARYMKA
jgi:hypothetical protein